VGARTSKPGGEGSDEEVKERTDTCPQVWRWGGDLARARIMLTANQEEGAGSGRDTRLGARTSKPGGEGEEECTDTCPQV
jgi:hypothetical protein